MSEELPLFRDGGHVPMRIRMSLPWEAMAPKALWQGYKGDMILCEV